MSNQTRGQRFQKDLCPKQCSENAGTDRFSPKNARDRPSKKTLASDGGTGNFNPAGAAFINRSRPFPAFHVARRAGHRPSARGPRHPNRHEACPSVVRRRRARQKRLTRWRRTASLDVCGPNRVSEKVRPRSHVRSIKTRLTKYVFVQ